MKKYLKNYIESLGWVVFTGEDDGRGIWKQSILGYILGFVFFPVAFPIFCIVFWVKNYIKD